MSKIRAEQYTDRAGTGAPSFPNGVEITGIVTATSFSGSGANLTGTPASSITGTPDIAVGNVNAGIATFTTGNFTGTVSGVTGSFTGNVSVGGTLTYEDVTNVDSVGVVTARSGVKLTGGNYSAHITAMGANAVDCAVGNYFTKTITGATTFTFTNAPSSVVYSFTMEVTCNGSNAITWPATVKWPADTAPTLTDAKTQLFTFITDDGGTRWRGSSQVDYVN